MAKFVGQILRSFTISLCSFTSSVVSQMNVAGPEMRSSEITFADVKDIELKHLQLKSTLFSKMHSKACG
jgi:hypothetical protein